jgi:hypothetical protein
MDKRKVLIKRLKSLKQNQGLSEAEIEQIADEHLADKELKDIWCGLSDTEIEIAIEMYKEYLKQNSFESLAERSTLVALIYKEILKRQIQEFIKKEREEKNAIPTHMTEKLMELDAQILSDKEKLGMLKIKASDSLAQTWAELKEKVQKYYDTHGGEIYYKCPYCQQLSRQILKIDGYEIEKAPMFKGTTVYNEPLLKLYHAKKLSVQEVADILGVHPKYVTTVYEQIFLKDHKDDSQN